MKSKKRISIALAVSVTMLFSAYKATEDYFEISKNLDIFAAVYKEVNVSYVDQVKPGQLIKEAIDAMLFSLDPYTNFYSEAQAEDYRFQVTGSYGGIGANVFSKDGKIVVNRTFEGFPAQLADIRPGDVVLAVDGQSVAGKESKDLTELLKGTAGTAVTIKVDRPGHGEMNFEIERAQIKVKNVPYYGKIDNETGYIKLTGFTPNAGKEVKDAFVDLREQGIERVILDLRGNGGGLLHEAVNIVNVFVDRGELVVETKGRDKEDNRSYQTLNTPVDTEMPLVVLVDGQSASASEIVSGTIQDLDRGVVIGRKSFGKGLVQATRTLTYNTQMKLTTAKYYIPSGRCIQKLDYSQKKNGKATVVADSLKHTYFTRNKRPVLDGEGITPDITVEKPELSKISQSLLRNDLIFDFATNYRNTTDSIPQTMGFELNSDDLGRFKSFLDGKHYGYQTDTEKAIEQLKTKAKEEDYFEDLEDMLSSLNAQFEEFKTNDLQRHRDEIRELLESEISYRYYFETALVESSFDDDPDISRALELFNTPFRYNSILQGSL